MPLYPGIERFLSIRGFCFLECPVQDSMEVTGILKTLQSEVVESGEMELLLAEMERLAAGRIAEPVNLEHYSGMRRDLAARAEDLRQLVYGFAAELQVTVAQVASATAQIQEAVALADELAGAFDNLRNSTALVEMVMQGLARTVTTGEQALARANQAFQSVTASSEDIKSIMEETNEKLDSLKGVVGEIDGILVRIGKIADRTRLLSLNAAIEAAHAGVHGRGFGIVAQEMRNLADKSSQGVKETAQFTQIVKSKVGEAIAAVTRGQQDTRAMVEGVAGEVEESMKLHQATMTKIVEETRQAQEKISGYSRQLATQLAMWGDALESLRRTTNLLQRVGEALTTAVSKVVQNGNAQAHVRVDDKTIAGIIEDLQHLAILPEIQSLASDLHEDILKKFLDKHDMLEAIYSNHVDGTFIFSEPAAGLANAKVRPWWQEAIAGRVYKSPVYISAITRQPCLTIAVPIPGSGGKPAGVLGADLRVRE